MRANSLGYAKSRIGHGQRASAFEQNERRCRLVASIRCLLGSIVVLTLLATSPVAASEVDDLRAELHAMQMRLDKMERQNSLRTSRANRMELNQRRPVQRDQPDAQAVPEQGGIAPGLTQTQQPGSSRSSPFAQTAEQAPRSSGGPLQNRTQNNSVFQPTQPGLPRPAGDKQPPNAQGLSQPSGVAPDLTQPTEPGGTRSSALPPNPTPSATPGVVTGGDLPGTFKLPGTDTSVGIHGFVSLQGFYDPTEYLGPKFQVGNITSEHSVNRRTTNGTFHFHPKLTRFGIETNTPTSYGDFHTVVSSDFYGFASGGDANQALGNYSFGARLYHGYASLGRLLIGQFWSNFIDDPDQSETLDNAGPAGAPSERQPQIRWTQPVGFGAISASVENPQASYATDRYANNAAYLANRSVTPTSDAGLPTASNRLPDLTAKYEVQPSWGHAQRNCSTPLSTENASSINGIAFPMDKAAGVT